MQVRFRPTLGTTTPATTPKPGQKPGGTPSKPFTPERRQAPVPTRREAPHHCPGNLPSGPCRIN